MYTLNYIQQNVCDHTGGTAIPFIAQRSGAKGRSLPSKSELSLKMCLSTRTERQQNVW